MDRRRTFSCALVAVAIMILALALRLHHLDRESLFMDELVQVSAYGLPASGVAVQAMSQAQPPLDYLIGSWFTRAIADSDYVVRLPAALFGSAACLLMFLLVQRFAGFPAAAYASLVLALSPYHIYYSQEARPYSLPLFLLLATGLALVRIEQAQSPRHRDYLGLLLASVLFLYSSGLYPLVVVSTMCAALVLGHLCAWHGHSNGSGDRRSIWAALTLGAAVLLYLPVFLKILVLAKQYAPRSQEISAALVATGLERFSWRPLWEGLVAQSEPFVWLLGAGVLLSMLPGQARTGTRNWTLPAILLGLIGLFGAAHIFVFQAATDQPFRPPYAGYLFPGAILVSALGVDNLYRRLRTAASRRVLSYVIFGLVAGLAIPSLLDFKVTPKRADWRSVALLSESRHDQRHVLIFSTLGGAEVWKPTFLGFARYYGGIAAIAEIEWLIKKPDAWLESDLVPVFILFEYDDYLLTSRSSYPVLRGHQQYRIDRSILNDPALNAFSFRGMWVIEPSTPVPGFRRNFEQMVEAIRGRLPDNAARKEWDALAAALAASPAGTDRNDTGSH